MGWTIGPGSFSPGTSYYGTETQRARHPDHVTTGAKLEEQEVTGEPWSGPAESAMVRDPGRRPLPSPEHRTGPGTSCRKQAEATGSLRLPLAAFPAGHTMWLGPRQLEGSRVEGSARRLPGAAPVLGRALPEPPNITSPHCRPFSPTPALPSSRPASWPVCQQLDGAPAGGCHHSLREADSRPATRNQPHLETAQYSCVYKVTS